MNDGEEKSITIDLDETDEIENAANEFKGKYTRSLGMDVDIYISFIYLQVESFRFGSQTQKVLIYQSFDRYRPLLELFIQQKNSLFILMEITTTHNSCESMLFACLSIKSIFGSQFHSSDSSKSSP